MPAKYCGGILPDSVKNPNSSGVFPLCSIYPWLISLGKNIMEQVDPSMAFLTAQTIAAYGGASIAVVAVSNTLRQAFNVSKVWVPLAVSILVAYAGLFAATQPLKTIDYILPIFNACIIFTSAAGINSGLVGARGAAPAPQVAGKTSWLERWI
jgi:hypothetical protein